MNSHLIRIFMGLVVVLGSALFLAAWLREARRRKRTQTPTQG